MQNNELEAIAASMNEAIHRAYALGRGDALRRVVEMVQADELGSKAVALLEHSEPPPAGTEAEASTEPTEAAPTEAAHNDNAEAIVMPGPDQPKPPSSPPSSIKNFLLDYLYPLGAKK